LVRHEPGKHGCTAGASSGRKMPLRLRIQEGHLWSAFLLTA